MKPSSAAVLELLEARGSAGVSALEALDEAGSFRLAARIADLRADGVQIDAELEASPDGKRYARYRLSERYAGFPIGRVRTCPGCRREHESGRTCSWPPETRPSRDAHSPLGVPQSAGRATV